MGWRGGGGVGGLEPNLPECWLRWCQASFRVRDTADKMDHAQPKTARTDVDVIIIGAGISGLTAAHKILKNRPQAKVIVLEAKGE